MIHMAQRILLPSARLMTDDNVNECRRRATLDADLVRSGPSITIDAVAEYFASSKQESWGLDDFPNCAPPFPGCLFQWSSPRQWHGQDVESDHDSQEALTMVAFDLSDDTQRDLLIRHIAQGNVDEWPRFSDGTTATDAMTSGRWLLEFSLWMAFFSPGGRGEAMFLDVYVTVVVASSGKATHVLVRGGGLKRIQDTMKRGEAADAALSSAYVALLAISFMHCKNIIIEDDQGSVPSAKWHRRQGIPIVTHKVLNIAPMREVLRREGGSDEVGGKRALHICRGHFATYTDERPLFGRVAGTFWVPQHVRGTKEAGEVIKDYAIRD